MNAIGVLHWAFPVFPIRRHCRRKGFFFIFAKHFGQKQETFALLLLLRILLFPSRNLRTSTVKRNFFQGSRCRNLETSLDLENSRISCVWVVFFLAFVCVIKSGLVCMSKDREPVMKPFLTAEELRFRDGISNMFNKGSKRNILRYISCL